MRNATRFYRTIVPLVLRRFTEIEIVVREIRRRKKKTFDSRPHSRRISRRRCKIIVPARFLRLRTRSVHDGNGRRRSRDRFSCTQLTYKIRNTTRTKEEGGGGGTSVDATLSTRNFRPPRESLTGSRRPDGSSGKAIGREIRDAERSCECSPRKRVCNGARLARAVISRNTGRTDGKEFDGRDVDTIVGRPETRSRSRPGGRLRYFMFNSGHGAPRRRITTGNRCRSRYRYNESSS